MTDLQDLIPAGDRPLDEAALCARLRELGYTPSRLVHAPGSEYPAHSHWYDKIKAVVNGRLEVCLGEERRVLEAGDWIAIPGSAEHSTRVLGEAPATTIDATRI